MAQMLSPFPQYNAVTYYVGLGNSTYHSVQANRESPVLARVDRAVGIHLQQGDRQPAERRPARYGRRNRNPYDGSLDKALGVIHRPHLVPRELSFTNLPFGKTFGGGNMVIRALVERLVALRHHHLQFFGAALDHRFGLPDAGSSWYLHGKLQPLVQRTGSHQWRIWERQRTRHGSGQLFG